VVPTKSQMKNRVCKSCGDKAKMWDTDSWWCGIDTETVHGACKNDKVKHKITKKELNNLYRRRII
jgi:hypothetical protein